MNSFLLSSALNDYVNFTYEEITMLQKVTAVRHFKKKEIILAFGEKETYISCVAKGLVRKHIMCGERSISTEFAAEGGVVCSNSSFGNKLPSEYCIEAIEPTTLISFTLEALEWLYKQSPVFFEFGKIIVAHSLLKCEEREIMLMKYDAQKRFNYFMETKTGLFLRLPQNMIASYLNIQPETFSKLKRQAYLKPFDQV
jgi:CRP-like cAMP-binding protein